MAALIFSGLKTTLQMTVNYFTFYKHQINQEKQEEKQ